MNRNVFFCRILLGVLTTALIFSSGVSAANEIVPTWNLTDIGAQTRRLTTNYNGSGAVIGGGSVTGNANGNTLIIDTPITVSAPAGAFFSGTDYVAGGVAYNASASNNTLSVSKPEDSITGPTIEGRTLIGGGAFLKYIDYRLSTGTANGNTVTVTGATIKKQPDHGMRGDVIGGYTDYAFGHADHNTVEITNSTVEGSVFGGQAEVLSHLIEGIDINPDTGEIIPPVDSKAEYNTVKVIGSTVGGMVAGSFKADTARGNTVLIDKSNVGDVVGAVQGIVLHSGTEGVSVFDGNTVTVQNESEVDSVVAFSGYSALATNNTVTIDNSTINGGQVNTVINGLDTMNKGTTPIHADVSGNKLFLSNMATPVTVSESGASLNLAGTANDNIVKFENVSDFKAQRDPSQPSFAVADVQTLRDNELFAVRSLSFKKQDAEDDPYNPFLYEKIDWNSDYGFIYGGASFDYTRQVNNAVNVPDLDAEVPEMELIAYGGTNSDNNTLTFTNSKVTGNIAGGISAELREINYATWATSDEGLIKTQVTKVGGVTVSQQYKCDASGNNCTAQGDPDISLDDSMKDKVFSASNNTILFDNSTIGENSVVYGGIVAGADLLQDGAVTENNTVILKGNTQVETGAKVYGGNSTFGRATNKLIFDHNMVLDDDGNPKSDEYVKFDKDQFENFNDVWTINADPDTRLEFTESGVKAFVVLDQTKDYDENVSIIIAKTEADLTNVEQNAQGRFDLTDTSIELDPEYDKRGAFSFYLTDQAIGDSISGFSVGTIAGKKEDDENVETMGQVPLAGMALVSEGTEMLNQTFKEAWTSESDLNVFVNGGYHDTRYTTGSGFDMKSEIAQVGIWKKFQSNWLGGLFAKYAHGTYETFPIHSKGSVDAYALGLMTSYYYSETGRIEGNVEVGKIDMDFKSNRLHSNLDTDGLYFGFLAGIVQDMTEDWELFANLQFLHKAKDEVTDSLGESVVYDSLQTATLRFGTNYIFSNINWDGLIPSVGIMGLYEMLGKSDVNVIGLDNDGATLNGFSARAQARLTYHNESFFPIISELTAYGQVGKRRGWGGEANISFLF